MQGSKGGQRTSDQGEGDQATRRPGEQAPTSIPPATTPPPAHVPKRVGQFQCPRCGHYGCPREGGHTTIRGVTRYRRCGSCQSLFTTFQKHGLAGVEALST